MAVWSARSARDFMDVVLSPVDFFINIAESNVMNGRVKSTTVRRISDTVMAAAARSAFCTERETGEMVPHFGMR